MSDQFDWIDLQRYLAALPPPVGTIRPEWITPGAMPRWMAVNAPELGMYFKSPLPVDERSQPWAAVWLTIPGFCARVAVSPEGDRTVHDFRVQTEDSQFLTDKLVVGDITNHVNSSFECALSWQSSQQRQMIFPLRIIRDKAVVPTFDDLVARRFVNRLAIECRAEITPGRMLAALQKRGRPIAYQVDDAAVILDRILESSFGIPIANVDIGSRSS